MRFRLWRCLFMERHILGMGNKILFSLSQASVVSSLCDIIKRPDEEEEKKHFGISKLEIRWASEKKIFDMCVCTNTLATTRSLGAPPGPNF